MNKGVIVLILLVLYYYMNGSCNSKTTEKFSDNSVVEFVNDLNSLSKNLDNLYTKYTYTNIHNITSDIQGIITTINKQIKYNDWINDWIIDNDILYLIKNYNNVISEITTEFTTKTKHNYNNDNNAINNVGDKISEIKHSLNIFISGYTKCSDK